MQPIWPHTARRVPAGQRDVPDLAGRPERPADDLAVDHEAGGEAGADAEVGEARTGRAPSRTWAPSAAALTSFSTRTGTPRRDSSSDPQRPGLLDADVERHRDRAVVVDAAGDPDADSGQASGDTGDRRRRCRRRDDATSAGPPIGVADVRDSICSPASLNTTIRVDVPPTSTPTVTSSRGGVIPSPPRR